MAHKQFTTDDIILIENYYLAGVKTPRIVELMGKKQPVYNVITFFRSGRNSKEFWKQRKENQSYCGRKPVHLSDEEEAHVENHLRQGWSLDVIANAHKANENIHAFSMGGNHLLPSSKGRLV